MIVECDQLRLPHRVGMPDSRVEAFVTVDLTTGERRQRTISDQYEAIASFVLNDHVPTHVTIHSETAKNLYLYAWFVYRFYSVAEQQALATLEFALREKFRDFVATEIKKHPRAMEPGLGKLMKHAISGKFVANERFSTLDEWAQRRSKARYQFQKCEEARRAGLNQWVEDDSEIVVTQEDIEFDWLGIFVKSIPPVRNDYAHGSRTLRSDVTHTFEIVSEIINQVYTP
jgi:hypothetical protein